MNLEAISRAYIHAVDLDDKAQDSVLAEETALLRADLHALLMTALREAAIPFADRTEAARLAFEIAQGRRDHVSCAIHDQDRSAS